MGNQQAPKSEGQLETYFAGEFAHALDEKGRLAVPAKFRARFKEGAVVTRWMNECLAVFPTSEWESINAEIRKRPRTDRTVQTFVHFLVGGAHEADLDAQGRIGIPAHLRQYAGLGSDAVVEIFPGKNHGNLMTPELRSRIAREMAGQFRKNAK